MTNIVLNEACLNIILINLNEMKKEYFFILFSIAVCINLVNSYEKSQCEPFGIRINYGRGTILRDGSKETLGIRFNTLEQCSHIYIKINHNVVECDSSEFTTELDDFESTQTKFRTFIHKCSIKQQFSYRQPYYYNLWDTINQQKILQKDINLTMKNPQNANKQLSILILADWGPITNPQMKIRYPNISQTLIPLVESGLFDCVVINGDIGYEFNSNQAHHLAVMQAIQQIASKIPLILNKGNHQRGIVSQMFTQYFELYDLDKQNATGFKLGPLFLMLIDPSNEVWPRERKKFTKQELSSCYVKLSKIMDELQILRQKLIPILFVHYPLICGYPTKGHCLPNPRFGQVEPIYINLKHYYDFVTDHNIPLVISGHVHVYQRSYPLISHYRTFSKEKHHYISNNSHSSQHFFIHVIEGVSGNNDGIESDYLFKDKPQQPSFFIANHRQNIIGFGILTAGINKIRYQHYSLLSNKQIMLHDNFTISFPHPKQQTHQQQL